jgi:hypothetical protein
MHAKSNLDIRLQLLNLIRLVTEPAKHTSEHDEAQKEAVASMEMPRYQFSLASNLAQT